LERPILAGDNNAAKAESSAGSRLRLALGVTIFAEVFGKLAPFIAMRIALERMGIEAFGYAQYSIWLIEICGFLVVAGYQQYGAIAVAQRLNQGSSGASIYSALAILKAIHFIVVGILLAVLVGLLDQWAEYRSALLILSFALVGSIFDGYFYFMAARRMAVLSTLQLLAKFIPLVGTYFLVQGSEQALLFAALVLGGNSFISFVTGLTLLIRHGLHRPRKSEVFTAWRSSWPFSVSVVLVMICERFELLFVERYFSLETLGGYAASARLMSALSPLIWMSGSVFFSEIIRAETDQARRLLRQGLSVNLAGTIFIFLMALFYAETLLTLVFGPLPDEAFVVLRVLSVGLVLQAVYQSFGHQWLPYQGRIRIWNLLFIPALVLAFSLAWLGGQMGNIAIIAASALIGRAVLAVGSVLASGRFALAMCANAIGRLLPAAAAFSLIAYVLAQRPWLSLMLSGLAYAVVFMLSHRQAVLAFLKR
jgi:O-antigen/teichoic acid export membrane protein